MSTVIEAHATADDIHAFIAKVAPVMDGTPLSVALAGSLVIFATAMAPDITDAQLTTIVRDTSAYLSMQLSLLNAPPTAVN